jgi:large subunit ribosomal protein L25
MDELVRVLIPVNLTGSSIGVKEGGILDWQIRELHIECLPGSIPDAIDVDVANLGAHDYVRVSELKLPEGVRVLDDPDRVVVGVTHAKAEVEAVPAEAAATVAEPEVIKKGKGEEEDEKEKKK